MSNFAHDVRRKAALDRARHVLDALPDDWREEILSLYCPKCGCKQFWHPDGPKHDVPCQCKGRWDATCGSGLE